MLLDLLRFLRGYVRFEIHAPFPERFLNILMKHHVRLWNTVREGERMFGCMYMSDYRRIRPLARRARARLSIDKRYGLPVFLSHHRDRAGVVIGVMVFFLTVFVMSQFVWSIRITGLERISQARLTEDLRAQGFYVGAFKPSCDFSEIARNVMIANKDVGWMAINVQGSFASVEIKEESLPPKVEDVSAPCNIKALCDGTVIRVTARQGESVILEGSGVVKDQLLVSGVLESEVGGVSFVHCDAEIMAQTVHRASFSVTKERSGLRFTGETKQRKRINLLGLNLPLSFASVSSPYSAVTTDEETVRLMDTDIPLSLLTERVSALCAADYTLSEDEAKEILSQNARLYEAFSLSLCEVYDREERLSDEGDRYTLDVTFYTVEDIACQSPILIQEE